MIAKPDSPGRCAASSAKLPPNLVDTLYAFTSPELLQAQNDFHDQLRQVSQTVASVMPRFMPLEVADPKNAPPDAYASTISASIQY